MRRRGFAKSALKAALKLAVLAALLFGTLRSGSTRMQSLAGIPVDIISIIQGLVIVFVAAPAIIHWLYRIRAARAEEIVLTRGWGS